MTRGLLLGMLVLGAVGCTTITAPLGLGDRAEAPEPAPPNHAQTLLEEGLFFYRARQYAEAVQRFKRVRQMYPETPQAGEALYWIGAVGLSPGNPKRNPSQAVKALRAFIAEQPTHPKAETAQIFIDLVTRIQAMEKLAGQLQSEIQQLKDIHLRLERLERRLNP